MPPAVRLCRLDRTVTEKGGAKERARRDQRKSEMMRMGQKQEEREIKKDKETNREKES